MSRSVDELFATVSVTALSNNRMGLTARIKSGDSMRDSNGDPIRKPINSMFCAFHAAPFIQVHGGLAVGGVVWQRILTELLEIPHILEAVERIEARSIVSRRDAIDMTIKRTREHLKLSACCIVGDEKMKQIYNDSWNRSGLKLK